jgi:hypothetical protein
MPAFIIVCILLTWLLCAAVCAGVGSLLLRALSFVSESRPLDRSSQPVPAVAESAQSGSTLRPSHFPTLQGFSLLDSFWTGVAVITAILQLYHFFRPIDLGAVFLLMGLGLGGWIWNRASLLHFSGSSKFRFTTGNLHLSTLLLFIAAAIIAFRCVAIGEHYDTGLYGAQAVRWFITYPLVPGLGNLLGQLGFNSSVFLWFAALDQGPWRGLAHHLFDGFSITALFACIIPAAVRILQGESTSPIDWFCTLLFVPGTIWATTSKIVGTNTDLPTSVVCLVGAVMLFRALTGESLEPGTSESDSRPMGLVMAMALFSLAVTFKISSVVFASLGWTVAAVKLLMLSRNAPLGKRQLMWAMILSGVIVLPWIGRGIVLTGYPLFPSTVLAIPVDWRVPALEAQQQADFARSFARVPELTYEYAHGWSWLRPWFRELVREREGFLIPLFFALAGGAVGIIRTARGNRRSLPQCLWLLAPSLGGLIFWFLEAPAMRFGEPLMWTAGGTLGTFAALHFLDRPRRIRMALGGLLLLTAWAAHPRLFWSSYFRPSVGVRTFLRLPAARLRPHQTASGLTVYVPVETNQCWDAQLPCSYYFHDRLRLREPGKLERGFASESSGTVMTWK